jgi:hypothetical protein
MPSPEIQAYLEAKEKWQMACMAEQAAWQMANVPEDESRVAALAAGDAATEAYRIYWSAWLAVLPSLGFTPALLDYRLSDSGRCLEEEFVWFPILVEEFDGNREAAEVAWALGLRPAGYSEATP